jgi:hypothetical protein
MLGKPGELRIRAGVGKDLGVSRSDHAPALALERPAHDCRTAASSTGADNLVDEVNELIWKAYSYLLAHPNMVADGYQYGSNEHIPPAGFIHNTDWESSAPKLEQRGLSREMGGPPRA